MNEATLALVGGIPIVTVFVLLAGLRWSAVKSMSVGWLLATGLGLAVWRMDPTWWTAAALYGALQALEIILIVFGAILLMNHLKGSGAVSTIRWHIPTIAEDRRVQLLLIGLGFVTVIEGAAGFGTPGALAAPLLIGLGFPPLAAAVFGLVFNSAQPPFGAAGTPVLGGVGAVIDQATLAGGTTVPEFLDGVTGWSALLTGTILVFLGLLGVFLLILWFGPAEQRTFRGALRGTLPVAPFALLLGGLAGGTQFTVAWFFGPALPDIAAGFVVLGAGSLLARRGFLMPRRSWSFPARDAWPEVWLGGLAPETLAGDASQRRMPVWLAWTPYLLVALVLLVTRWPGLGLADALRRYTIDVPRILGQDLSFSLAFLYLPGVVPFIPVAVLTGFLHRMELSSVAAAWRDSFRQIAAPAATLIVAVSLTQVMIHSATNEPGIPGMMDALSRALALGAGALVPFVAPWIGALGAFMTGSNTSSNILFSVLQHNAAADVGLSRTIVVALQNVGGGIGNMVSVLNIAAISGVVGMSGLEGDMLRRTVVPTIVLAVFAGLAGLALAFALPGLY